MKWGGSEPKECNVCDSPIKAIFIDGRVNGGTTWCLMCPTCHSKLGVGLGTGQGQKYELQEDGTWLKIEG